jgi:hypothetical protein
MAALAFDAVLQAFLTALRATPSLAAGHVLEADTFDGIPQEYSQAIVVGMDSAVPSELVLSGAPLDWGTVIRVDCMSRGDARATDGTRPSSTLFAAAHARLVADQTLGGVAGSVELLRVTLAGDIADTTLGVLSAFYRITHRSTGDTLLPT